MHIPRRHIPGLNPAAAGARCGIGDAEPSRGGGGEPGDPAAAAGPRNAPLAPSRWPQISPRGQTSRVFRVSGQEGELKRSLRTLLTSRESTGPSRGKGWGKRSAEGKGPANTEGTKATPRRALSRFKTRGRLRAVGKCEKHRKQSVARPGGVAPGASAGRLALRDLSPGAAGLAAESEGGSLGPRALRHACPRWLAGETPARP